MKSKFFSLLPRTSLIMALHFQHQQQSESLLNWQHTSTPQLRCLHPTQRPHGNLEMSHIVCLLVICYMIAVIWSLMKLCHCKTGSSPLNRWMRWCTSMRRHSRRSHGHSHCRRLNNLRCGWLSWDHLRSLERKSSMTRTLEMVFESFIISEMFVLSDMTPTWMKLTKCKTQWLCTGFLFTLSSWRSRKPMP